MNVLHITVGLAVSQRHTYLFSAGDDKQVKCWDLEQNKVSFTLLLMAYFVWHFDFSWHLICMLKVIRSYHGHLSGVYCLALHPTIDILLTGGRDSVCRVWIPLAIAPYENLTVCNAHLVFLALYTGVGHQNKSTCFCFNRAWQHCLFSVCSAYGKNAFSPVKFTIHPNIESCQTIHFISWCGFIWSHSLIISQWTVWAVSLSVPWILCFLENTSNWLF